MTQGLLMDDRWGNWCGRHTIYTVGTHIDFSNPLYLPQFCGFNVHIQLRPVHLTHAHKPSTNYQQQQQSNNNTMSSAEAQNVYQRGNDFVEPNEAQESFSQQFDLSQPEVAMSAYQQSVPPIIYVCTRLTPRPGSCTSTPSNNSRWPLRPIDGERRTHQWAR